MKRILALLLSLSLLSGCSMLNQDSESLNMEDMKLSTSLSLNRDTTLEKIIPVSLEKNSSSILSITDFSLDVFRECYWEGNTMISPLSIATALSMLTMGAEGETLSQLEDVLGTDYASLRDYLYSYHSFTQENLATYASYLENDDQRQETQLHLANSVWFKDDASLTVQPSFLISCFKYFDGESFTAPFDDSTKDDINLWVKYHTNGMIDPFLQASLEGNLYLINALSFEADWAVPYGEQALEEGIFTSKTGEGQQVTYMNCSTTYRQLDNADGFSKAYYGGYSFAAFLPEEGISMEEFISSLDGQTLQNALSTQIENTVAITSMPKFSFESNTPLSDSLKELGVIRAFDETAAQLENMAYNAYGSSYVEDVLHRTKIEVFETGTRAAAVTAVVTSTTSSGPAEPPEYIVIDLNRPFFFVIYDNTYQMPIFMGVVNHISE